jgi:hypothetical protein
MKIALVLGLLVACLYEAAAVRLVEYEGGAIAPQETPEVAEARERLEDAQEEARAAAQGDEEERLVVRYGSAAYGYGPSFRRTFGYGHGRRMGYGGFGHRMRMGYGGLSYGSTYGRGLRWGSGGYGSTFGRGLRRSYGGFGSTYDRGLKWGYGGQSYGSTYGRGLRWGYGGLGYGRRMLGLGFGRGFKSLRYSDEEA